MRLQENDTCRLKGSVKVASQSYPGRTYTLPAGTLGSVLLERESRYEVEFVIVPPFPGWRGIEAMDCATAVIAENQLEKIN